MNIKQFRKGNSTFYAKDEKKTYWIGGYAVLAFLFLALHFLFKLKTFAGWEDFQPLLKRFCLGFFFIFMVMLTGKVIERLIHNHGPVAGNQYNLLRITRLIITILILFIGVSFLFEANIVTAAVGFGLISLVLGFALQAPISSFIAWLYIIFRTPYQVGNRIQIGDFKGDVIEIGYLDTVLLEFGGDYLQNDRSSGRMIHFPNSLILRVEVFNYSGPSFPFIWNETAVQIGYTSDLQFVEECLMNAALQDFMNKYPQYNLEDIPQWKPGVYFRVNEYAWLEAVVMYPVEPFETTPRRTRILKQALATMNKQPEKVKFPEGTAR